MKTNLLVILLFFIPIMVSAQNAGFTRNKKTNTTTPAAAQKQQTTVNNRKQHVQSVSQPARISQELRTETFSANGVSFKMCYVKGGTFLMGATSEQSSEAGSYEKPAHKVTVNSFYIGQTEVTQALWQAVMGNNPSNWKGGNLPVEQISWYDCQTFIEELNSITGCNFRLPTEAEWEFASRGGNNSRGYKYSGGNNLGDVAWFDHNSKGKTHAVATKKANELGIYDMSGNVWEWCSDWYDSKYYKNSGNNNPLGANTGSRRVYRGSGWRNIAKSCRVSNRSGRTPDYIFSNLGFRLALVP